MTWKWPEFGQVENNDAARNPILWQALRLVLITAAVYLSFRFLLPLFLPFLIAYGIARLLRRPVRFLHKRLHLPRAIGALLLLLLFLSLLGAGLFFLLRLLITQTVAFFQNLPVYRDYLLGRLDTVCDLLDQVLRLQNGTVRLELDGHLQAFYGFLEESFLPSLTQRTLRLAIGTVEFLALLMIVFVSTILLVKDLDTYETELRGARFFQTLYPVCKRLSHTGLAYLKTQLTIIFLVALASTLGLLLQRNSYALLLGIGIALFDAFPILGSGMILVPWCIIRLFAGDFFSAAILISMYLVNLVLREFLEPRLLGGKIGIRPVFTMMAIFIGVRVFGFAGFLLGPFGLILILELNRA